MQEQYNLEYCKSGNKSNDKCSVLENGVDSNNFTNNIRSRLVT